MKLFQTFHFAHYIFTSAHNYTDFTIQFSLPFNTGKVTHQYLAMILPVTTLNKLVNARNTTDFSLS